MKVTKGVPVSFFFRSSYIQCTACGGYLTVRFFEFYTPHWWVWRMQTAWPQFILVLLMPCVYFYSLFENSLLYNGDTVLIYSGQIPRSIAPKQPEFWPLPFQTLIASYKVKKKQPTKPKKPKRMIIHRRENFSNVRVCSCLLTHLKEMFSSQGTSMLLFWLKLRICLGSKSTCHFHLLDFGSHQRVGDFELDIFYPEINLEDVSQECTQCSLTTKGHAAPQYQIRFGSQ